MFSSRTHLALLPNLGCSFSTGGPWGGILILQAGSHSGLPIINGRQHLPIFFHNAHLLPLLLPLIYTGASLINGSFKVHYTTVMYLWFDNKIKKDPDFLEDVWHCDKPTSSSADMSNKIAIWNHCNVIFHTVHDSSRRNLCSYCRIRVLSWFYKWYAMNKLIFFFWHYTTVVKDRNCHKNEKSLPKLRI